MIEFLKLASIILVPLIPVVITSAIFYRNRHSDNKDWSFSKYCFSYDPNHGLTSQPIFWMTIIYPIGLFFSTGIWIWQEYSLDISAAGYNKFIEISKLPIGLLGLSIPLSILTSRLHGTKQTALQIDKAKTQIAETQQKNKTDLYLAHYKHFCDFLAEKEKLLPIKINNLNYNSIFSLTINKKLCYEYLYPNASLKDGIKEISIEPYKETIQLIENILTDTIQLLKYAQTNELIIRNFFVSLSMRYEKVFSNLFFYQYLSSIFRRGGTFPLEKNEICLISNFSEIVLLSNFIEKTIRGIYSFEGEALTELKDKFDLFIAGYSNDLGKILPMPSDEVEYLNRIGRRGERLDWNKLDLS